MDEVSQGRRAVRATGIVAMLMLVVAGMGCAEDAASPSAVSSREGMPSRASPLARAALGDEEAWMEVVSGRQAGAAAPTWFSEELFFPEGAIESFASEEGSVLGFVYPGSAASRAQAIAEALVERGWLGVPSGVEGCATFVKGGGLCRWAMVSCTDVSGRASVVVQVGRAE